MGITNIKVKVKNPALPEKQEELELMVDSGAAFSVIPESVLKYLDIKSDREEEFSLVDGTKIKRKLGDAIFEINGKKGASPVIFGEEGDAQLLGVFTLEALGLILDPFKRELRPAKLLM